MSFWKAPKRRTAVRVAVVYALAGSVLVLAADTFFPITQSPRWTMAFVAALILGLPIALVLFRAYAPTPESTPRSADLSDSVEAIDDDAGPVYTFDGFRVSAQRRRLSQADGQPITLAPRVFDTLLYLVERPGELLDKRVLLKALWPNTVVEENNLNKAISTLRHALGETPGQHRFIVTEPGRGYRFVATVHAHSPSPGAPNALIDSASDSVDEGRQTNSVSTRWPGYVAAFVAALAIAIVVVRLYVLPDSRETATLHRIAVLPFEDSSAAEENSEFFANGMHADLLALLNRIGSLSVISGASVQNYREGPRNLPEIGRALGVASILEGSVQRSGNRVHVHVELIDADTNTRMWRGIFDEEITAENIFAIQNRIAQSIAEALHTTLTSQEMHRLAVRPTEHTDAYEFYLRALDFEEQGQMRFPDAIANYERAIAEDPEFALAHARLGMISVRAFADGIDRDPMRLEQGRIAAEHALDLERELPEAHLTLAYYHFTSGRMIEAQAELLLAAPNAQSDDQFFIIRGSVNERLGRWEQALEDQEKALELNPRDITVIGGSAGMFRKARDYDAADRTCERMVEVFPERGDQASICAAVNSWFRDGDVSAIDSLPLTQSSAGVVLELQSSAALRNRDYDRAARLAALPGGEPEANAVRRQPGRVLFLATVHELAGREDLARQLYQQVADAMDDDDADEGSPAVDYDLARRAFRLRALAGIEPRAAIVELAQQLTAEAEQDNKLFANWTRLQFVRDIYVRSDRKDIAIRELDNYLSQPGEFSIESLLHDPSLEILRDDPAFAALVEKHRRR